MNDAERIERAKRWCEKRGKRPYHRAEAPNYCEEGWGWHGPDSGLDKPWELPDVLTRAMKARYHATEDAAYLALDAALEACKAAVGLDEDTVIERCAAVAENYSTSGMMFGPANIGGDTQFYDQPGDVQRNIAATIRKLKGTVRHADQ